MSQYLDILLVPMSCVSGLLLLYYLLSMCRYFAFRYLSLMFIYSNLLLTFFFFPPNPYLFLDPLNSHCILFRSFYLFIYFWLCWVSLLCRLFSSCGEGGLLFVATHRLLIVVASFVEELGL